MAQPLCFFIPDHIFTPTTNNHAVANNVRKPKKSNLQANVSYQVANSWSSKKASEGEDLALFEVSNELVIESFDEIQANEVEQPVEEAYTPTKAVRDGYGNTLSETIRIPRDDLKFPDSVPVEQSRCVFDLQFCKHPWDFPGVLMRSEGEPALERQGDPAVNQCYDHMGIVRDFYREVFGNHAILGEGIPLVGIVHYDFYFPNAWWHERDEKDEGSVPGLIFGDGWDTDPWKNNQPTKWYGGCFGNFVGSLEIVAHEMTHGMVHSLVKLETTGQSGSLHEHLADVFGTMCEQWHKRQAVGDADWLVGEDLIAEQFKDLQGFALRSVKAPGTAYKVEELGIADVQVDHMNKMIADERDVKNIYANMGILNKAFYLVAKALGGNSWEKPGKIWYAALKYLHDLGKTKCNIGEWASITVKAAKKLLKQGIVEQKDIDAVLDAWKEVGVVVK
ncbi:hypothetical protein B0H65DRAFT_523484 [Neurospora tetraspora]|uniref:Metalloprotease n=1 Tax=Neurospora tetraspora TaxID=94610 RepID=A0AAE0MUR8_9PEZI|nr:hypothetical protein B0H65DRAFT_523484 [Neurospora tetraspora]